MIHKVAFILLIVGGLNWLLTAFGFNLVNMILGGVPMLEMAVYVLVGLSAVYELVTHKGHCRQCSAGGGMSAGAGAGGSDVTHG